MKGQRKKAIRAYCSAVLKTNHASGDFKRKGTVGEENSVPTAGDLRWKKRRSNGPLQGR